jgi:hypothetical protein
MFFFGLGEILDPFRYVCMSKVVVMCKDWFRACASSTSFDERRQDYAGTASLRMQFCPSILSRRSAGFF